MSFEIENRVSKSPIQSIDLSDFLINKEFDTFDIRNWLKDDLILIEKDFRNHVKSFDWSIYKNKLVSISCSTDAIIPDWAFMLISSELNRVNNNGLFMDKGVTFNCCYVMDGWFVISASFVCLPCDG